MLHEFGHRVYGIKDIPNSDTNPGPLETTYINPGRSELSLAERQHYKAKPVPDAYKGFFPGGGLQLQFKLAGKDKFLRWSKANVGGNLAEK
jgi:hypothetical protein